MHLGVCSSWRSDPQTQRRVQREAKRGMQGARIRLLARWRGLALCSFTSSSLVKLMVQAR